MRGVLVFIRSLSRRTLIAIAVAVVAVFVALVALLGSPGDLLGLLELAVYICAILALSAGVTFAVVKILPVQTKPKSTGPS
jgi:multidrug efflux pump subunit AcrB